MKHCYICKQKLDESAFYKDDHADDGLTSSCIACQKLKSKDYYKKVKDQLTDKQKAARRASYLKWKANNPERYKELTKKHNDGPSKLTS